MIALEQFGFLQYRLVHESIGSDQEGLHAIKTNHLLVTTTKIDLSKTHNIFS